ncbi:hypothetical protein JCM33374_g1395 [Metschnikowia sp. JCM 33374]|nr:hypothetical protein JCM33374_g1395 [Metschnikowia sp. JCM 33374]
MAKIEWNVIVYDKPGTDRTSVRPQHVAAIPASVNDGTVTSVGAIYTDASKTKFAGSTFHMMAESRDEIIDFLKKDIYYESGIWDLDNVVAHPVGIAARVAKAMPGVTKI